MKKVIFCVIMTALLFGTMEVALKMGGSEFDSLQLTFLRFLIGGIILLPFAAAEARQNKVRLTARDLGWLALVGMMGVGISMVCFQYGVDACNAATASVLICLNPLFTMVIAHIFTSEKMDRLKAAAMVIGLIAGEGNLALIIGMIILALLAELIRRKRMRVVYAPSVEIKTTGGVSTSKMPSDSYFKFNKAAINFILKTFY